MNGEAWRSIRLGYVGRTRSGDPVDDLDGDVPVYGAGKLLGHTSRANAAAGEVVVGRVGSVGSLRLLDRPAWATDNTIVLSLLSSEVDARFVVYAMGLIPIEQISSGTAMPLLTASGLMRQSLLLPSLLEQVRIANYLDRETARLDLLTEQQMCLIDMLRERQDAVISDLVLRGVDATARLRATPFDFIGSIPSHWNTLPFRRVFAESQEVNGPTPVGVMLSVSGYRGVEEKQYSDESLRRSNEMLENYRVVRPGQLAVNTMWLNYAGLGVSDYLGHVSPAYRSYDFLIDGNRRYFHHLLRSRAYVSGYTGALRGIRPNSLQMDRASLMSWPIVVPPLGEQKRIALQVETETDAIETLIDAAERLIALSRERRSALITAAVTGQIDVRREVA